MSNKQGYGADLRKNMDLPIKLHLNGDRHVNGILKGYDPFMNIVLDEAIELKNKNQERKLGTIVIRGNSIIFWENLQKVRE